MAKKMKDQNLILKWKKKKWFSLLAPDIFGNTNIGELIEDEPSNAIGKQVVINYQIVSGNPRKQKINLILKVVGTEGSNLKTDLMGWELLPSMLKRIVRKKKERVDDSFVVKTNDDLYVRLKPIVITAVRASRSVTAVIRNYTKKYFVDKVSNSTFKELTSEIINESLQRDLKSKLMKILPVQYVDLRYFKVIDNPTNRLIKQASDILNEAASFSFELKGEKAENEE